MPRATNDTVRLRRKILGALAAILVPPKAWAQGVADSSTGTPYARVVPGYRLRFPQDHGAHPEFRTEWWYVTGSLQSATQAMFGFQVTFFRSRAELKHDNPSAFTPRQIVIGHAAVSDPREKRLRHDQRIARQGFGLAGADTGKTHVWIDKWSLEQQGGGYRAVIPAGEFGLELAITPTQPPLLNGTGGFSRKGPRPEAASYYYSMPQLQVNGTLTQEGRGAAVTGRAWLDHEWSSSYLEPEAAGWDWIGINAIDGGALMAFRMRGRDGEVRWSGATYRSRDGKVRVFDPGEVTFTPRRTWRSPRSGARYPVHMEVRIGEIELVIEPWFDDQENDAQLSTGTIYWEGAVRASRAGHPFGRGYLELTGYWRPLKL